MRKDLKRYKDELEDCRLGNSRQMSNRIVIEIQDRVDEARQQCVKKSEEAKVQRQLKISTLSWMQDMLAKLAALPVDGDASGPSNSNQMTSSIRDQQSNNERDGISGGSAIAAEKEDQHISQWVSKQVDGKLTYILAQIEAQKARNETSGGVNASDDVPERETRSERRQRQSLFFSSANQQAQANQEKAAAEKAAVVEKALAAAAGNVPSTPNQPAMGVYNCRIPLHSPKESP